MTADEVLKLVGTLLTGIAATWSALALTRKYGDDKQGSFLAVIMADRKGMQDRLDKFQDEIDELRKEIVNLRTDLLERQGRNLKLEAENDKLKQENLDLRGELRNQGAVIAALRRTGREGSTPTPISAAKFGLTLLPEEEPGQ